MTGPRQATKAIRTLQDHGRSEELRSESTSQRLRRSPRILKPSLRIREISESLAEGEDLPIQPSKKRFRVSELRATDKPVSGSSTSEERERRVTNRGGPAKRSAIKKPNLEQREHRPSSDHTSKRTPTHSHELQSALYTQYQTLSAGDDVGGARYESDEYRDRQVTPPQTTSETASRSDVIEVSSTSSYEEDVEEEEEDEEEGEDNEGGGSKRRGAKAQWMEGLEPEEAEAFLPDEDIRVTEVENRLSSLQQKGGSNRSQADVIEEQEDLGIQTKEGRFKGVTLEELESGLSVSFANLATLQC